MLGNTLKTLGTHQEVKETSQTFIETSWEPLGNFGKDILRTPKLKKNKNHLEISFKTSPKNKPNIGPT